MLKAYLEANIVNWARRANWTGTELRKRLHARGLEPHFGPHGIYELTRGLLSQEHKVDAQSNFGILGELEPIFVAGADMLLSRELGLFRTGAAVIPVLNESNRARARHQVSEMAAGRIEDRGAEFVRRRQASFDRDHPRYVARQLDQIREAVDLGAKRPKTFDQVLAMSDSLVPAIIRGYLRNQVTVLEAEAIHAGLDKFPALRSTVRSDLYLWATPWMNDVGASRDKTDDYRNVIEASYSEVFITGDGQLARGVPHINPNLEVLTWDDIEAR